MGDEDILGVGGITAQLGVEVASAVAETAVTDYLKHGLGKIPNVYRELVGIPAVLGVAAVGVDAAQHAVINGYCELVLEGMAGQGGVVNLDVYLEVFLKAVGAEEADNGLCIYIVLVFCRLHRLGLDKEGALEALGAGIVTGSGEHFCKMVFLTLHLGVQEAGIALAAAPENVVCSTKLDGCVDGVLDLDCSACNNVEIGVGGSAVHITLVAKDIGGTPQEFDIGTLHLLGNIVRDFLHAGLIFLDGSTLLYKVYIVETEVLYSKLLHNLEAGVYLILCTLNGAFCLVPFIRTGLAAELVAACLTKCMPPGHCELEPILHLLTQHYPLGVIVMECKGVFAFSALKGYFSDGREVFFHNRLIII